MNAPNTWTDKARALFRAWLYRTAAPTVVSYPDGEYLEQRIAKELADAADDARRFGDFRVETAELRARAERTLAEGALGVVAFVQWAQRECRDVRLVDVKINVVHTAEDDPDRFALALMRSTRRMFTELAPHAGAQGVSDFLAAAALAAGRFGGHDPRTCEICLALHAERD